MLHILLFQWLLALVFAAGLLSQAGLRSIFNPGWSYLAFHTLVFVVRPTLVAMFGWARMYHYMNFYPSEDDAVRALLIADLGAFAFIVACYFATVLGLSRAPLPSDVRVRPSAYPNSEQLRAAKIVCAIFFPLVLVSMIHSVTHPLMAGGFNGDLDALRLVQDRATGATLYTNSTAYITSLQYAGASIGIIWAYVNRFRLLHCLPFAAYALLRASQGNGRFAFLLLSAAFGFAYLAQRGLRWPTVRVLTIGLLLAVLFSQLGDDRRVIRRSLGMVSSVEEQEYIAPPARSWSDRTVFDGPDFANFDYLEYVVHYVPEVSGNYTWFAQYATLAVKPIPRMIWPGKPVQDLSPIRLQSFGNFIGLTTSLVGDGWMSAGFVGVIITLSMVGFLFGRQYALFMSEVSPIRIVGYSIFLALSSQWFRDGGVSIAEFLAFHLLPVISWALITRYFERQGRRAAAAPMRA